MSTTMHFGPEWMRTTGKHSTATRPHNPHSPPPTNGVGSGGGGGTSIPITPGINTQSSSLSLGGDTNTSITASASNQQFNPNANQNPTAPQSSDKRDPNNSGSNPPLIRYSKEQLLRIYRETGGKAGVGVDSEKWEALHESLSTTDIHAGGSEDEKKRFPDSGMRRRQSSDLLTPSLSTGSDRPRLNQMASTGPGSPMRERFGGLVSGRRRESSDQTQTIPRKLSLSSPQNPLGGSRDHGLPSPRGRGTSSSNFDGVLNTGGDSWMARRQALKTNPNPARGDPSTDQADRLDNINGTAPGGGGGKGGLKGETPPPQSAVSASGSQQLSGSAHDLAASVSNMSLHGGGGASGDSSGGHADNTSSDLPPDVVDFASIQWSYLDPQGQVQGPFRADIMQKWHDDGYFTQDLLMKRVNLDTDWMTVAEITRRSTNPVKLFLVPIGPPPGPPGLARMTESPHLGYAPPSDPSHIMSTPHQPAPLRSLRASALESYVGNGSNPSDSPASSFGAGRSADPSAFGGRAGSIYFQEQSGFVGQPDSFGRRNTFAEGYRASSTDLAPGSSLDNIGFAGRYNSASSAWPPQHNIMGGFNDRFVPDPASSFSPASGLVGSLNGGGLSYASNAGLSQDPNGGMGRFGEENHQGGSMYQNYADNTNMSYNSPSVPSSSFNQYINAQQQQQHAYQNSFGTPVKIPQANNIIGHDSPLLHSQNASPWGHQQQQQQQQQQQPLHDSPALNRAAVFDSPLRSPAVAQTSSWNQPHSQVLPTTSTDNVAWNTESPVKPTQLWPDANAQSTVSNLTISNVGKHNLQQDQPTAPLQEIQEQQQAPEELVEESPVAAPEDEAASPVFTVEDVQPATSSVTKTRKGSVAAAASSPTTTKPTSTVPPPVTKAPTPPPAAAAPSLPAKPAWSIEEEVKKPKVSTSISLREIQEAEAKKAEARKAAERERERAARAAAVASASSPTSAEESAPFTATWGLSGARGSAIKEPPSASSSATSGSAPSTAWTAAAKASAPSKKKTMKEIQEEEEKRKAASAKAAAAAAAATAAPARRGYAESTVKSPAPVATNSAWTTVGAGGKVQATAPTPTRPAATPTAAASTSTSTSVPRVNGVPPRQAPSPMITKTVSAPRPADDIPTAPSHEFLRWLSDSLKGLNSSVNVEEIMSMLLTFPVEADASTLEIISDLIYANSTTLDGRRFASEFSTKRKADALTRPKVNGASGSSSKPVSIADVVKAQPKPTQPEWGGFKVVNKKKKGGRA